MLKQLRHLHELCLKHEQFSETGALDRLIELHETDHDTFWSKLGSLNMWGGMGSLADQCLVSSRTASEVERK